MTDIFDLFTEREESYGIQLWWYGNNLSRLVGLVGSYSTPDEAKDNLREFCEASLDFADADEGLEVLASWAYDESLDLAVVFRVETFAVVSYAALGAPCNPSSSIAE